MIQKFTRNACYVVEEWSGGETVKREERARAQKTGSRSPWRRSTPVDPRVIVMGRRLKPIESREVVRGIGISDVEESRLSLSLSLVSSFARV